MLVDDISVEYSKPYTRKEISRMSTARKFKGTKFGDADLKYARAIEKRAASRAATYGSQRQAVVAIPTAIPGFTRTSDLWRLGNVRGESKFHDTLQNRDNNGDPISTYTSGGIVQSIVQIPQTNTAIGREGMMCNVTKVHVTMALTGHNTLDAWYRVMLVLDKQCNGTQFTVYPDLLTGSASNNISSMRNLDQASRFDVLYDKKICVKGPGFTAPSGNVKIIKFSKNKQFVMKWSSTNVDGSVASMKENNLCIVIISDGSQPIPGAVLQGMARVRYTDR